MTFSTAPSLPSALYLDRHPWPGKRSERGYAAASWGLFCLLWIYTPSFGQVFLWLDGALNYLWSVLFSLLMLKVYAGKFRDDRELPKALVLAVPAVLLCRGRLLRALRHRNHILLRPAAGAGQDTL